MGRSYAGDARGDGAITRVPAPVCGVRLSPTKDRHARARYVCYTLKPLNGGELCPRAHHGRVTGREPPRSSIFGREPPRSIHAHDFMAPEP
eukprot:4890208-Prymnesium_polylepis.2